MDPVIVAMATFPPRRQGMVEVVNALLPQCDRFYLYLNGYTSVPEELPKSDKLVCVCAGPGSEYPDIGSHGKFHWIGMDEGYYLTVDDDIYYPSDYVAYLCACVDKYERKAVVGLHGAIFRTRPGGAIPPRLNGRETRALFPYDKRQGHDMGVHMLGMGVMACHPRTVGLTSSMCTGPVHSGDDEDMAVWAQQHQVPLIKVATERDWTRPNPTMWIRDPLHRRGNYIKMSDQKLRLWTKWTIQSMPRAVTATTAPMPPLRPSAAPQRKPLATRLAEARQARIDSVRAKRGLQQPPPPAQAAPVIPPRPAPNGPCFDRISLTDEDLAFTQKILSSDALAAQIVDRIKKRVPTSLIRMSDGERAIIEVGQGKPPSSFLCDSQWLRRYGLEGADLKLVGQRLLRAGAEADYLACTISGLFWSIFKVHDKFPERQQFVDQFYPQLWECTDRVGAVLRAGPVLVLHRQHEQIVPVLRQKYVIPDIEGLCLNSWTDHNALLYEAQGRRCRTILVSGGASGKPFCVDLARETGKVVLDVGEALTGCWTTDARSWHDASGRPMK